MQPLAVDRVGRLVLVSEATGVGEGEGAGEGEGEGVGEAQGAGEGLVACAGTAASSASRRPAPATAAGQRLLTPGASRSKKRCRPAAPRPAPAGRRRPARSR